MNSKEKIFVLDTNVILHDSGCIYHFQEHNVVIPITVLEELDSFKKGNETLNFHAREFVRELDSLSGDHLFNGGVNIGPEKGNISIFLEKEFHDDLKFNFSPRKPDHHILNTAYQLAEDHQEKEIILVSKDVNLRMKAKSLGLMAQDYMTDQVKDISALYTGLRVEENLPENVIEQMYQVPFEVEASALPVKNPLNPNEYLIMRNGRKSALGVYNPFTLNVHRVEKTSVYGITPRNAEQTFALNALMNTDIPLVSISGKAGTGKTLLALAAALERRKNYRQIYLARPIVPLSNKDIGFLPGDIQSKLDPYMQPLYDNLGVIQNQFPNSNSRNRRIKEMLEEEKLVISPLSYIRGRSLVNIYFIVDEAQNLTPHEIKTIITRAGEGTKVIFTGDIYQIDHPYLDSQSNGLSYLIDKMQGQKIYAHINLEKGERSELAELASNLL
ncbi:MAG: PhoH family protein [Candidatus Marinimicrobia bacterium]|nr:PhoH family protein [Candidatus Neomarinimicrobiota bacterium]MCF7829267.1 PhoH family protein [Candidatus Neomarinimicrobiota bacterium]MCF7881080.1 PhoH family protein [Candidatus Neomarinimicrobiota bacterium]